MQNDEDGDGRMSRTEFRRLPQIFNFIDADRDGYVTPAELEAAWRKMGHSSRSVPKPSGP
jgi:Ca2+-binding EF-hand superfamily protein